MLLLAMLFPGLRVVKNEEGKNINKIRGSGCGSVGRTVASNSRGPRFKSHHRQKFILNILLSIVLKRRK